MSLWCKKMPWHDVVSRLQIILKMLFLSIQDLEAAINYWRSQSPAVGEELHLCPEAAALAKPYALMIVQGSQRVPVDVLDEIAKSAIQKFFKTKQIN